VVDRCALSSYSRRFEASRHDRALHALSFSADNRRPRCTHLRVNAPVRRRSDPSWQGEPSSPLRRGDVSSATRHRSGCLPCTGSVRLAFRDSSDPTIPIAPSGPGYAVQFNSVYPLSGRGHFCHYAYSSGAGNRIKRSELPCRLHEKSLWIGAVFLLEAVAEGVEFWVLPNNRQL
jgi:hypothetical protein